MPKPGISPTALVIGRGLEGARTALDLAQAGAAVTLLTSDEWLSPGADGPLGIPTLLDAARHPAVTLLTGATVDAIAANGRGLRVVVGQSPRFVDPELCTACGACTDTCPVLLPESGEGPPHKAIYRGGVPTTYVIDKLGTAPCRDACPIHQRAQGYVALIRAGDYERAYRTILRDNPFPSVCGRVCNHRCEDACSRNEVDSAVSVMALKRFVTDWARDNLDRDAVEAAEKPEPTGKNVAVVGAGPAGLTCGLDLVRQGHAVTVYEALPAPGGMMRVGVPDYRLPPELVEAEINEVLSEGVELVLNHRVDDVPGLLKDGFDAVFVSVGAHGGIKLPIPGSDLPGVLLATDFLREVSFARGGNGAHAETSKKKPKKSKASRSKGASGPADLISGRRVLVLGGGNVAIDTAMTAVRLGASWVGMSCLESRETMPAHDWEVRDASEEGVDVFPARTFKEVVADDDGAVAGVRCVEVDFRGFVDMRPDFDEIPDTEEVIPADVVIFAIGQRPETDCLQDQVDMVHGRFVAVDEDTMATSLPGLFAGGDLVTGTAFIVDAIAAGRRAARSIDRFLRGLELSPDVARLPAVELDEAEVERRFASGRVATAGRGAVKKRSAKKRRNDFLEVYGGLSEAQAQAEATRCLSCGFCSECLQCVDVCPAGAISHDVQPRTLQLSPDAVIWTDGTASHSATPELSGDLSGVFVGDDGAGLDATVDQALSHLRLSRRAPEVGAVAPSRWPAGNGTGASMGVFLCRCGGEIERTVDLAAVATRIEARGDVTHIGYVDFACHPEGFDAVRSAWDAQGLDRAVLAACSCCALDQVCYSCTTQRTRCKERLGVFEAIAGMPVEFVNVREQCAFVHRDNPAEATAKAGDLVSAAVAAMSVMHGEWNDSGVAAAIPAPPGTEDRMQTLAVIDPVRCRGCEDCEETCGLDAVHVIGTNGARIAQVDAERCLGCGVCMAVCSSGAILATDASDPQVIARLSAMGDLSDKTVVFSCNWGAYSAVEAAGAEQLQYDPSVRLVRLMCAGRAHPGLILRAFAQGAARVLLLSCGNEGDESLCHYHTGAEQARRAAEQTQGMLAVLGIDPARLTVAEMQPGAGARFLAAVEQAVGVDLPASAGS